MMADSPESDPQTGFFESTSRKFQFILDKSSPHILFRWIFFVVLLLAYFARVYFLNGWFIVTYGLGIYLLNQFIGFLTPQFDPEDSESLDGGLPVKNSDEFRPFARRLPEFKFWYSSCRSIIIAFGMTFSSVFDVPVFWPILLLYFIVLFFMTMQRQIKHMIKYKYVPFSWGKTTYGGKSAGKDSK